MTAEKELTDNIMLHYHNVHGRNGFGREVRIHHRTTFLARKRVVEHLTQHTEERFLPFLPLKHRENREYLEVPENITTEEQLLCYVEEKKPFWLDHHSRRNRRRDR